MKSAPDGAVESHREVVMGNLAVSRTPAGVLFYFAGATGDVIPG